VSHLALVAVAMIASAATFVPCCAAPTRATDAAVVLSDGDGRGTDRRPRTEMHTASTTLAGTELDCGARALAYEYALRAQPWRGQQHETFDALQLGTLCGEDRDSLARSFVLADAVPAAKTYGAPEEAVPAAAAPSNASNVLSPQRGLSAVDDACTVFVDRGGDDAAGDGTIDAPYATVHRALAHVRACIPPARTHGDGTSSRGIRKTVILRGGMHYVGHNGTIELGPADSGTTITNYQGEVPWLSGGVPLIDLKWREHRASPGSNIWVTSLKGQLRKGMGDDVRALFTVAPHRRVARARVPNMDVERDQWGYASPGRDSVSLNSNMALEWGKPPTGGTLPQFTDIDLSVLPNPAGYLKNDSAMASYNAYNDGQGGVCSTVWGTNSYWCGNASAGGWAEVDFGCAGDSRLQIPVSLKWNRSVPAVRGFSKWANASGAVVMAWHSQTWAMHMFTVESHDVATDTVTFRPGSGSQGGRNWCRCNQCAYAAGLWSNNGNWCGRMGGPAPAAERGGPAEIPAPPPPVDTRLIGGSWVVENVFEELDAPNEFFYNASTQELFLWPNATTAGDGPPSSAVTLVVPILQTIVAIKGPSPADAVHDVTIAGISFRDAVFDYQEQWGVPSGGDWALQRRAALFVENTRETIVDGCTFQRLDGNAVLLSAFNRNVTIANSTFAYIGCNAVAGWGNTDAWDGLAGDQPRHTLVRDCYMHDLGLLQKQSSGWFQAKTAQRRFAGNIGKEHAEDPRAFMSGQAGPRGFWGEGLPTSERWPALMSD